MSQSACPEEGANALDCAENGASRQLGAPKVAWKRRPVPRNEFTALFEKAGSEMEGAGEARQSVPMVKGVDYRPCGYDDALGIAWAALIRAAQKIKRQFWHPSSRVTNSSKCRCFLGLLENVGLCFCTQSVAFCCSSVIQRFFAN